MKLDVFLPATIVGFATALVLERTIIGHQAGKGVPGQTPVTFAQCIASGAPRACCVAAAAHHNPGINNPDPTCGMKGYYMNNCNNCGQPECSGGNTYPTGSVKPGQQGYSCGTGLV